MPRYKIIYPRQKDPAEEARKQAAFQAVQQRQAQTSAYAAARFQEWAANAPEREALLNARLEQAQSQAELAGAQFRYNFWKDQELRRQTTAYYTAMPVLQEQLRQNGIYPGSQRYAAEMSAFAAELPDAVTHNEAIRNDLKNYAKVDATSSEIADRVKTFQEGMRLADQRPGAVNLTAAGQITGTGNVPIAEQAALHYAKVQGNITAYQEQAEQERQANIKANKPNTPFSKAGELHANQIQAQILERNFPQLNPAAQQTQASVPSPTPTGQPPALEDIFGQQQQTP